MDGNPRRGDLAIAPFVWLRERVLGRGWVFVGLCLAAIVVAFGVLSEALAPAPQGPVSSSYATNSQGLAAWAELAQRAGHPVIQQREPLDRARLAANSTVVVLDPDAVLHSEGVRLLAFVKSGGSLLIGGSEPQNALTALFPDPPAWSPNASTRALPLASAPVLAGVRKVNSAGAGEWTSPERAQGRTLLQTDAGGALLLARRVGRGQLYLLADASPLQNRLLATADNAQLALNLAGAQRRALVFVESVHGYGQSRGLAALPNRWRLAFALLALAALLWIVSRWRGLGPPERLPVSSPPPRRAYVDALALLLRRTGQGESLKGLRRTGQAENLKGSRG
jgi:hypothetical protein